MFWWMGRRVRATGQGERKSQDVSFPPPLSRLSLTQGDDARGDSAKMSLFTVTTEKNTPFSKHKLAVILPQQTN